MPKSKALKVKEANFRNIRGEIVDLCRSILELEEFYKENFDNQLEDPIYKRENEKREAKLELQINALFQLSLPSTYTDNCFSGWVAMPEFKEHLIQKNTLTDNEKKLLQIL